MTNERFCFYYGALKKSNNKKLVSDIALIAKNAKDEKTKKWINEIINKYIEIGCLYVTYAFAGFHQEIKSYYINIKKRLEKEDLKEIRTLARSLKMRAIIVE